MNETPNSPNAPITGMTSNGVPFLVEPATRSDAPVVVAWHLMDAPRSEAAMASALPLAGLDATKIYLGLPRYGSRLPVGGLDEIQRLGMEDAVLNLHWPVHEEAIAEFPGAFAELRERFDLDGRPLGLLGGSIGSAIACGVLARGETDASAAVLVSPMLQLRAMVEALGAVYGVEYPWSAESNHAAERMDYLARAAEVTASGVAIRVVVGSDDTDGAKVPAREFAAATGADLQEVDGVGHALADEPGIDAAPQTAGARTVDALAAEWLRSRLGARRS